MMGRPWTIAEIQDLKTLAPLGLKHIAWALDRSEHSIRCKAHEHGISLKVSAEVEAFATIRPDTSQRLVDIAHSYLCPACGARRASVKTTGFCGPCHYDLIIETKKADLEVEVRHRQMTALRQQKRRLRVCEDCGQDFYPRLESRHTLCPDCR